jgi:hypothetical protein
LIFAQNESLTRKKTLKELSLKEVALCSIIATAIDTLLRCHMDAICTLYKTSLIMATLTVVMISMMWGKVYAMSTRIFPHNLGDTCHADNCLSPRGVIAAGENVAAAAEDLKDIHSDILHEHH